MESNLLQDITTKDGLIYDRGVLLTASAADEIARGVGYQSSEQLVRYLESLESSAKANRDWSLMGSSYITPIICDLLDDRTFLTPIEVYQLMKKLMKIDLSHVKRVQWGSRIEAAIIKSVEDDYGVTLEHNKTLYHPSNHYFCSTPDGVNFDERFLLECKNVDSLLRYKWENGDGPVIPRYVYVQTQWHLHLANMQGHDIIERALVRALFGGNDDKDYWVDYDPGFGSEMEDVGKHFIENYVEPGVAPPIDCSKPYSKYLLSLYPPDVVKDKNDWLITDNIEVISLVKHALTCRDACDIADDALQLAKNKLQNVIGEKYGVKTTEGNVSWYPRKGSISKSKVLSELVGFALNEDDHTELFNLIRLIGKDAKAGRKTNPDKVRRLKELVKKHTFQDVTIEAFNSLHTGEPTRVLKLPNRK